MCGRFLLLTPGKDIAEELDLAGSPELAPRYNIAPSQPVAAARAGEAGRGFVRLHWGLITPWARDAKVAGLFLAVAFCLMPFSPLGAEGPWYFWVGSGLVALAASVLLSWVFFLPTKEREEGSGRGTRDDSGA
jgi:hypothetical protein